MAAALFIDLDKKSHAQLKEEGYRRPKPLLARGHPAAAPPGAASNSRRRMVTVIRPSRARCVEGMIPRHGRAVPNSAAPGGAKRTQGTAERERAARPTELRLVGAGEAASAYHSSC